MITHDSSQFPFLAGPPVSQTRTAVSYQDIPFAESNGYSKIAPLRRTLLTGYIYFLPVQVTLGSTTAGFTPWALRVAPSDILILAYLLISIYRLRLRPGTWCPIHPILVGLFALATYLGTIKLGYLGGYVLINKLLGLALLLSTYAVIVDAARNWSDVALLIRTFVLSVACHNVFALICFFVTNIFAIQLDWINYEGVRLAGLLLDPNAYGGLLTVALGAHISTQTSSCRLFSKPVGLLITLSLALGIALTFSRSCWMGFCLGLALMFLLNIRLAVMTVLAVLTSISILLLAAGPVKRDVIFDLAKRPEQIMDRVNQISNGFDMLATNPVFGTGLGVFGAVFDSIIHNTAFWFLVEFGLVGLSAFLFLYCWYIYQGFGSYQRVEPRFRPFVLGVLFPHVAMLGVSLGIEAFYQRHWWIFMALISACAALARERVFNSQSSVRSDAAA